MSISPNTSVNLPSTIKSPQPNISSGPASEIKDLKSLISSLQDSIQFFSVKFDDFKCQLEDLETIVSRVEELETKNSQLHGTISLLSDRVNRLEQSSYCNDLILCGIPKLEKDDRTTSDIVLQFINHTDGPKITNIDIRSAYRIIQQASTSKHKDEKKPPKILVKFHSTQLDGDSREFPGGKFREFYNFANSRFPGIFSYISRETGNNCSFN
jgi:hypothetical protein